MQQHRWTGLGHVTTTSRIDGCYAQVACNRTWLPDLHRHASAAPCGQARRKRITSGAQAGTSAFYTAIYDVLDGDEANPRVKLFDTFGASVQALKSGDVDAVIADQSAAAGYIGADPGAFKQVGDAIKSEPLGFILTPGSDLVAPLNAAIDQMRADCTPDALNKRWLFDHGEQNP